ncbi:MAG: hypothetical protein KBG02_06435 [Haliscomenobacter sp.]|nr:hypothetical protein [Haliscomenobacter sp.]MBP9076482.1 hypothetical protein [Haliscomenobacter sp.]MBP9872404.1 hypothetical protein [Haliscomenobacter sp.]
MPGLSSYPECGIFSKSLGQIIPAETAILLENKALPAPENMNNQPFIKKNNGKEMAKYRRISLHLHGRFV